MRCCKIFFSDNDIVASMRCARFMKQTRVCSIVLKVFFYDHVGIVLHDQGCTHEDISRMYSMKHIDKRRVSILCRY